MRASRRRSIAAIVAVVIAGAYVLTRRAMLADDLLQTSTPIWHGVSWIPGTSAWLSDGTMTAVTTSNGQTTSIVRLSGWPHRSPILKTIPFNDMLNSISATVWTGSSPPVWELGVAGCTWSSDGRALWQDEDQQLHFAAPFGARVRLATWAKKLMQAAWMPDGVTLAGVQDRTPHPEILIGDPFKPSGAKRAPLTDSLFGRILGCDSQQRLVVHTDDGALEGHQRIMLYPLNATGSAAIPIVYPVLVPPDYLIRSVVFSPKANRLLWTIERQLGPPDTPFNRLIRRLRHTPDLTEISMWTSPLGSEEMHRIGSLRYDVTDPEYVPAGIHDSVQAAWLPDGKRFSFTYHNRLYIHAL